MIVTADDAAYQAALDLHAAGTVDRRHRRSARRAAGELPRGGAPRRLLVLPGSTVLGTEGGLRVRAVSLSETTARGQVTAASSTAMPC